MKKLPELFIIVLSVLLIFSMGCTDDDPNPNNCIEGKGNAVTEEINLPGDITGFVLAIPAEVVLTKGPVQEVRISGQQNIIDNIKRDISNDNWEIEFDECVQNYDDLNIFITMKTLKDVIVSGVGNISATNTFDSLDVLDMVFSGVGSVNLDVEAQKISSVISGVGDMILSGTTVEQEIVLSGVLNYKAFSLSSDTCVINLSGSGNGEVFVNRSLDVTISGSGNVSYKGNPAINVTISGTGSLIDAN